MATKINACTFCRPDPSPDQSKSIHYTNVELIRQYVTEAGTILPARTTGLCKQHQSAMRFAIKNARFLALMSYTSDWHVPYSYVSPTTYPAWVDQPAARDADLAARLELKQKELELMGALAPAERADATARILKRKGVAPGYEREIEAKLPLLAPLRPDGFLDAAAPPNAPVPLSDVEEVAAWLEANPNAQMRLANEKGILAASAASRYEQEEANAAAEASAARTLERIGDAEDVAAVEARNKRNAAVQSGVFGFTGAGASTDEDAALDPFWAGIDAAPSAAPAAGSAATYSDAEIAFLRSAVATATGEMRAVYAANLTAALEQRALHKYVRGVAAPEPAAFAVAEQEAAAAAAAAAKYLDAATLVRSLGGDIAALTAKAEAEGTVFDAVAWVDQLRAIQAANKLRDASNPFDQGERVEDLKALHRMGFTGKQ